MPRLRTPGARTTRCWAAGSRRSARLGVVATVVDALPSSQTSPAHRQPGQRRLERRVHRPPALRAARRRRLLARRPGRPERRHPCRPRRQLVADRQPQRVPGHASGGEPRRGRLRARRDLVQHDRRRRSALPDGLQPRRARPRDAARGDQPRDRHLRAARARRPDGAASIGTARSHREPWRLRRRRRHRRRTSTSTPLGTGTSRCARPGSSRCSASPSAAAAVRARDEHHAGGPTPGTGAIVRCATASRSRRSSRDSTSRPA